MLILLNISGLSERLGGEEHLCSFLANTACKHRISHSLFLSCFVVHQFCLPAVQLGGQPRHWGVEPGFSPMPVQEIPPNTLLLCGLELPKACITTHLLTPGRVALPQACPGESPCVLQLWAFQLLLLGPVLVLQPHPGPWLLFCSHFSLKTFSGHTFRAGMATCLLEQAFNFPASCPFSVSSKH